jgi:hypothetical protein
VIPKFPDSYYDEIRERIGVVLSRVEGGLGRDDAVLIRDFLVHNELGLALESLSSAAAKRNIRLTPAELAEVSRLVDLMGLPREIADRMRRS